MKKNIIAHIPAREGSKRVKLKNLKLLAGKPMIEYAINACKSSKLIDEFYVNTESDKIADFALEKGASIYKRAAELAQDDVPQDVFNYDFICNKNMDILVLVNPVCPLITGEDIDRVIQFFIEGKYQCVATTTNIQLHSFYNNTPINFDKNRKLSKTQDLKPVQICNWAIGVWDAQEFKRQFIKNNYACFMDHLGLYEIPQIKGVKISTPDDFAFAETILKNHHF